MGRGPCPRMQMWAGSQKGEGAKGNYQEAGDHQFWASAAARLGQPCSSHIIDNTLREKLGASIKQIFENVCSRVLCPKVYICDRTITN